MTVFFVAPAYNEEANVPRLITSVDAHCRRGGQAYRLVVVDDGSRDRTADVVREHGRTYACEVISYQPNRGVDEAFRRGLSYALGSASEGDVIVTLEADGTGDLGILSDFFQKLKSGAGVVVASYYAEGGRVEGTVWYRKVLSWGANTMVRNLLGIRGVRTYSSFFRAYRPEVLRAVKDVHGDFFDEKGFACVVELLLRIDRLGFKLDEVPMVLQGANRIGKSRMKVGKTIAGYLRILARNAGKKRARREV